MNLVMAVTWVNHMTDDHDFYVITRNAAKCLECGTELESTHRHDFKRCNCSKLVVDGGVNYIKRSYHSEDDFVELSEYRRFTEVELRDKIKYYRESDRLYGSRDGESTAYSYWKDKATVGERLLIDWYSRPTPCATDMLNRQLLIGDYVVFTNCIYVVKGLPRTVYQNGYGVVRILLRSPSKTTRPVKKSSKDLVILPKEAVEALETV